LRSSLAAKVQIATNVLVAIGTVFLAI
jgi:hypothetical protein